MQEIVSVINGETRIMGIRETWKELAKDWPILQRYNKPIRRNVKFLVFEDGTLGIEEISDTGSEIIKLTDQEARDFLDTL